MLVSLLFLFFGLHNLLQEAILALPSSPSAIVLAFLEVLGVTIFTYLERKLTLTKSELTRRTSLSSFALLTFLLLTSSSLSNLSLNYLNYPTKVVFRSCKLIPTMITATVLHKRVYKHTQYIAAFAICLGLILYTMASDNSSSIVPASRPIGLVLVTLSVCADAVLPNAQEALFKNGATRSEVTLYTNILVLITMTASLVASGDLSSLYTFALSSNTAAFYLICYTCVSYLAITLHMTTIKAFGGVTTVLIGTARKAMTIVLSFVFFPKEFSWYYVAGTVLVLGGLANAELEKARDKSPPLPPQSSSEDTTVAAGYEMQGLLASSLRNKPRSGSNGV
jgi:adenosine 3'-phospho 5'-phosphosulfate transporter B3